MILKLEVGNIQPLRVLLSFLDKVCYLLCRSGSHQGRVLPRICFKMPQVARLCCKNTTLNAKWCVCPFSSNYIRCSKRHSFGNLKQAFCACWLPSACNNSLPVSDNDRRHALKLSSMMRTQALQDCRKKT